MFYSSRNYEWDKPGHEPIFHLLAAQRILEHNTHQLALRREFAKGEEVKLKAQWEDLYQLELNFKETFRNLSTVSDFNI